MESMELIKVVLIFQAIATLIIGLVFFSQAMVWSSEKMTSAIHNSTNISDIATGYNDLSKRFELGAYIVLVIAMIELVILYRI